MEIQELLIIGGLKKIIEKTNEIYESSGKDIHSGNWGENFVQKVGEINLSWNSRSMELTRFI